MSENKPAGGLRKVLLQLLLGLALLVICLALGYIIAIAIKVAEALMEITTFAFAAILYVVLLSLFRPSEPRCRY
ncbi:MAG: hypothetical protein K2W95_15275 [Candidatus Obscuribacterales bacterium]|nr:hypothetical protein [Candidatus Obscuribacterales bacterium]